MDIAVALSCFKVCVFQSDSPYLDRSRALDSDEAAISDIVLIVLKALSGYSLHHLLSPLLDLLLPDCDSRPRSFATPTARHDYQRVRTGELRYMQKSLRQRFSHSPITVLVTDTGERQWSTITKIPGMEHTIVLEQRLVNLLRSGTPEARFFVFMATYRELAHLFRVWYVPHSLDCPVTPKTMIDRTTCEPANIKREVGSFAEWASMGGVADWSEERGLFLSLDEEHFRYISTAEAQAWWDAAYYPHLVEFLDVRQSLVPGSASTASAFIGPLLPPPTASAPLEVSSDTRRPQTPTTPLNERSRTLSASPPTPPIASPPLPRVPSPPTTPTPGGISSLGPIRSSRHSSRSRTPYAAPPKTTAQDVPNDSDDGKGTAPFRTLDDLITSGMERTERLPGETEGQWLARVMGEATKAHPDFVRAPSGSPEPFRDVWRCVRGYP